MAKSTQTFGNQRACRTNVSMLLLFVFFYHVIVENPYSALAYSAEQIALEDSIIARDLPDCIVKGNVIDQTVKPITNEPSYLQCQDKCAAEAACFYFSYDSSSKQCRLHAKNISSQRYVTNANGLVGKKHCSSMCTKEGTLESATVIMTIVDGTVLNFDECHKRCRDTQICSSAAYDYNVDACYLFGVNANEKFVPKRGIVWGEKRCYSRESDVFNDTSLVKAGMTPVTQESWSKCRLACQKAPKTCKLWTYVKASKECFLMEHSAMANYKAQAGALSGAPWPMRTRQCYQYDTKFESSAPVVSTSKSLSADICQEKCRADDKCFFFAFSKQNGDCQLLAESGLDNVKALDHFISGPKTCAPMNWCAEMNVSYHYEDLRPVVALPSLNAQECKELCIREPRCQLWSHVRPKDAWHYHCYLKYYSALRNREVTNRHDSGHGVCGNANYCAIPDTYYGSSQFLRDLPIAEAPDVNACQTACYKDVRCYYYAFKAGALCRLYPDGVTPKPAAGFTAGPHHC